MKYLVKHESKIDLFEPNFDIEDGHITEEDFLEREIEVELYKAIRKLTERQREVLVLYYFKGKSHSEIAGELGIKVRTVINTKMNAIAAIRKELGDKINVDR